MKQFLILIDGMSGGGKTTVTRLLMKKLPRTAVVGFDKIKKFVSDFERGAKDNQIAREVTMVMAQKYLNLGLSVIVENPFNDEEIDFYTKLAGERQIPCLKFQLYADPHVALERVVERTKQNNGDLTKERAEHNISLFQPRGHLNFKEIDTTNREPQETAEIIFNAVNTIANKV